MTGWNGKTLAFAFVAVFAMLAGSQAASALGIRNCTDIDIRVNVYKGKDKVKLIPVRGGKASIGRGKVHKFRLGKGSFVIRVYGPKKLTFHLLESRRLDGGSIYSIRGGNGHYNVNSANDCPPANAALLPASGVWVTKRNGKDHYIRITRRSPTSFDVNWSPASRAQRFEQSEGDRYTYGYATSFRVQSETRIVAVNHLVFDSEEVYRFVRP